METTTTSGEWHDACDDYVPPAKDQLLHLNPGQWRSYYTQSMLALAGP